MWVLLDNEREGCAPILRVYDSEAEARAAAERLGPGTWLEGNYGPVYVGEEGGDESILLTLHEAEPADDPKVETIPAVLSADVAFSDLLRVTSECLVLGYTDPRTDDTYDLTVETYPETRMTVERYFGHPDRRQVCQLGNFPSLDAARQAIKQEIGEI